MDAIESHVVSLCEGYTPGTVFRLADGAAWVQVSNHVEYVLRDRPSVRVWRDLTGLMVLDVEGTSGGVRVERWAASGGLVRGLIERLVGRRQADHESERPID